MSANPAIPINPPAAYAYPYGYAGSMNNGSFTQPGPVNPQSFQSFNPGPYSSSTPQPHGHLPPQHFAQHGQGGLASPQNYGGNPQGRVQQVNHSSTPYQQGFPATTGPPSVSQFTAPTSLPQGDTAIAVSATSSQPQMMQQQRQQMQNALLAQQAQLQNAASAQKTGQTAATPQSPQSAARERARVTVLLEINTQLLQEVVSLQAQGKAGVTPSQPQPSPTSPTSATDPSTLNQSPVDPSKQANSKPPSQEYADCMRRLQANLSYLAAIADAKKKASGPLPSGPAIMIPPPHLTGVQDLYRALNQLFPEASQSTVNKALAFANSQASKSQAPVHANG